MLVVNKYNYSIIYITLLLMGNIIFLSIDCSTIKFAHATSLELASTMNTQSPTSSGPSSKNYSPCTRDTSLKIKNNTAQRGDASDILQLTKGETMTVSGTTSTLPGSMLIIEDSQLRILNPPHAATGLTISRNLTVGDKNSQGTVNIFGFLRVGNDLNINNGTVENNKGILSIDGKISTTAEGSLYLQGSSLTTVSADSLLKDINTINKENFAGKIFVDTLGASLILTGWDSSVISRKDYEQLLNTLQTLNLNSSSLSEHVALWGVTVVEDDGTPVLTIGSGQGYLLAGDKITMSRASANHIQLSAVYVAPQIVLDEVSDTLIIGDNKDTTSKVSTIGLPVGTVNLVQKADGSVGNVRVQSNGIYMIGSGKQSSGLLGNLEVIGTVAVNQGMQISMENLFVNQGFVSVSGADDRFTLVHAKTLQSKQGTLLIDSAMVSFDSIADNTLSSKIILGKDAVLGIGTIQGTAHAGLWAKQQQHFTEAHTGAALSGVLALRQTMSLETDKLNGQIIIDKNIHSDGSIDNSGTKPQQAVYFGDSSLLVIDASSADIQKSVNRGEGIIKLAGDTASVYISDTSHLRLHEAKGNRNYTIIDWAESTQDTTSGNTNNSAANNSPPKGALPSWTGAQVSSNTDMLSGNTICTEDRIVTRFSVNDASTVYKGLSKEMAAVINGMYNLGANNLNASQNGIRFLTRITDNTNTYIKQGTEARAIEGATRLAAVAGVHTSALAVANMGIEASLHRASQNMYTDEQQIYSTMQIPKKFAGPAANNAPDASATSTGTALWISPLYQSSTQAYSMAGFQSGTNSRLQGIAFGVDFIEDETERWGISYSMGTGSTVSSGDFAKSTSNFKFYGTNTYKSWYFHGFNLSSDLGISNITHTLQQQLPVLMDVPVLRATVDTIMVNTSLRGEYILYSDYMDIIPYLGLRHALLYTSPFETHNKDVLFSTSASMQNIFSLPFGVTVGKVWTNINNWFIKSYVTAGLTLNKGECSNTAFVSMPDIGSVGAITTPVVDALNYNANLGLQVTKNNLDFGFQYSLISSRHSTNHNLSGTVSYTF